MKIEYKIALNDFLNHQLYVASKSERIKKKRKRNKIVVPLIYAVFGLLFFLIDDFYLGTLFFMVGVLWFFIYPIYERRRYFKHYKRFIEENYKERVDKAATVEFSEDYIQTKDSGGESRLLTSEVVEICEIPATVFIRLKGGQSFILPKDKIPEMDRVILRLKELADHWKVAYVVEPEWRWR